MTCKQAQRHAFLRSLFQQVRDFEPDFPSPDEIQRLGIQVSEVSPADTNDGTLQFEPCYFKPHPEKLLEICLIHPDLEPDEQPHTISSVRSVQDLMNEWPTKYPPGVAPILTNLRWSERLDYDLDHTAFDQAYEIDAVIDSHLGASRQGTSINGLPDEFRLEQLRDQEYWEPDRTEDDPITMEDFDKPKTWRVVNHFRYTGLPHSVMSCLAHIEPTETNKGLTTHELRAIVNIMLLRVNHKPFRRCHIHPVLVLSFMGDQKGRIIQALYDGKGLSLQYSRLWSFENPSTAPLELFIRYRLSEPIGGVRTLSIR
ncbi:uncharacterized protein N7479_008032 [Penicillium vulpinum]|uniref:uncharacterized protein n=1 Tax=Penicillium vulpinum TaxID=29845 RepID=UPI0025486709|nr:uncharacterized protein N7479_008032 [Penicillium vulpinum]KAJ5960882.1 hypothetical protein N7479_008032 [Penicillium vulpinum]